ncbi:MAG: flagellar biosynthetic protein FliR [Myxococcota bacterium]
MTALVVTWLLVFGRVGTLVTALPVFSLVGLPRWVGALLALGASLLVTLSIPPAALGDGIAPVVIGMMGEVFAGATMGLGVAAAFAALALGGEIVAMQAGMSFSMILDPLTRSTESALAVFASWIAGLVFVLLGLPGRCLEIVAASFTAAPPGSAALAIGDAHWATEVLTGCTVLGVQLAGPVLALIFMVHVFVALLSKLAPKMQAFFSIGMTLTSGLGVAMLGVSLPWLVAVHTAAVVDAVDTLAHRLGR